MLNRITIKGRLTKDPEKRVTTSGKSVANFRIANDITKDQSIFIDCTVFGECADFVCRSFKKGSAIIVDGKLTQRSYTTKDGNKVTSTEILVNEVDFADGKAQTEQTQAPAPKKNTPEGIYQNQAYESMDDDLPW